MDLQGELGQQLERYLLGRLPPEEQEQLEARLFEGDDLLPAIQDAEDDLIDRYLAGALPADERDAFEHHFAASPLRQERIAFRRALPGALARATLTAPTPAHRPRSTQPWRAPAGLGLAAVLVVGLGWLLDRQLHVGPGSGQPSTPDSPRPDPGTLRPAAPPTPASSALVLRSGLFRDHGKLPRLAAPSAEELVRIDVQLDRASATTAYRGTLRSVEGKAVWKGPGQAARGADTVSLLIPGSALRPGDYILAVVAEGQDPEGGAEFAFRITPSAAAGALR
jgi:hypothetical protein